MKTDDENNEWKAEAPYLASLPAEHPFLVPEHYFETLPDAITSSVYVNELKQDQPASGYTVPDQYFSSLKNRILAQTTTVEFNIEKQSGAQEEYSRDDPYFTEVSDAEVFDAEEAFIHFPVSGGFSTPDQYFQKLQAKILAQTAEKDAPVRKSKIVRLWHSGLLKYASAACFVLVAAFGFYLNQQTAKPVTATAAEIANEQMLYDIDEQDIIDHVEGNVGDEPKTTATHAEMETYILNNYTQSDLSSEL